MNLNNGSRAWRSGRPGRTCALERVVQSSITINYLTPHPSDLLSSKCVIPYYEINRMISSQNTTIAARPEARSVTSSITSSKQTLNFSAVTLNQIPDKIAIFVRKRKSDQVCTDSDFFYPISNVNIMFNNQSGIASTFSQYDLWKMSKECGSNASWSEFKGTAYSHATAAVGFAAGLDPVDNTGNMITSGAPVMLEFGKHINLSEDYLAPGSIGNFMLQFSCTVDNYELAPIVNPELVLCYINSGSLSIERGTSTLYSALLTKADVLETSQEQAVSHKDVHRIIGGGFLDTIKTGYEKVKKYLPTILPIVKGLLNNSGNEYGQMGGKVLGSLGYGYSAGSNSGGNSLSRRLK